MRDRPTTAAAAATARSLAEAIRSEARRVGLAPVGIAPASLPARDGEALLRWLREGRHGEMAYLARDPRRRFDVQRLLPGARAIVVAGLSYAAPGSEGSERRGGQESRGGSPSRDRGVRSPPRGRIARYARARDYHKVLGGKMRRLADRIRTLAASSMPGDEARTRVFVDTAPLLERAAAQAAGIGFAGKHTNLITREGGNWVFLGAVITTAALPPDRPHEPRCGTCTRCLDACPTGALPAPHVLDARRCIAYLTIEHRGPIDPSLRPLMGDHLFGCDLCLAACPWNRFARAARETDLALRPELSRPDLTALAAMDEKDWRAWTRGTPLKRAGYAGFLRNVAIALGNRADSRGLAALATLLRHPLPLVRSHAAWALGRHGPATRNLLQDAERGEEVTAVLSEIRAALACR